MVLFVKSNKEFVKSDKEVGEMPNFEVVDDKSSIKKTKKELSRNLRDELLLFCDKVINESGRRNLEDMAKSLKNKL